MSLSEDQIQKAEDYLDGTLPANDMIDFENEMIFNLELKEYIQMSRELRANFNDQSWAVLENIKSSKVNELENFIKSDEINEAKVVIKKVNDGFRKKASFKKFKYYSYFGIAASIVILIGYFVFFNTHTNQDLFSQYNDWSNLPSVIVRSSSNNTLLVKGEDAFLKKDYSQAENYFKEFIDIYDNPSSNTFIYLGISQLELSKYDLALKNFDEVIKSNSIDNSKGYWYKALVYLKMDDMENAIKQLNSIVSNSDNYNFKEAKEILKQVL